jgi:ribosomal protein S18 acetylase RimI-like enzyme
MMIRQASEADLEAIMAIHLKGWLLAYGSFLPQEQIDGMQPERRRPIWQKYLGQKENLILVGGVGDSIDGFLLGGPVKDHEITEGGLFNFDCEVYSLHCRAEVQGQGLGRALLGAAAGHWRGAGKHALVLWAYADNPYRRFYERIGGKLVAQGIDGGIPDVAYGWRDLRDLTDTQQVRAATTPRLVF